MASVYKSAKAGEKAENKSNGTVDRRINKQRVLLLSSRGITYRHRHLMNDLEAILPQAKKDSKLDSKSHLHILNELAELSNCNNCIFFEVRKRQDLYMWISKTPNGPSAKLHIQNIHTMDELKLTGNSLKGSRHMLSFDKNFDASPHYQLLKEMFTQVYGVPKGARRSKPFIDHILSFSIVDNRIWFRNYQIVEKNPSNTPGYTAKDQDDITLVEIGPRFCMTVIRVFEGSFGGSTVFENPEFVSPNMIRAAHRREKATKYNSRQAAQTERKAKLKEAEGKESELSTRKVFG
ncbi:hypothetical protein K450DRAFT_258464 [Umbelopsis ramanniana AG]|uniref:Brix domain-containing protein n=1 Tax=Umbelopsis ramanniana AG TaxID=1314678 RepID=A0AAD5E3N0_UMBRA|nr:uncharacterized protein K450DRAFT_258464 [Umbelopsis ramanniana AG]KAI8576102.1 hypothetical protein K450DRAFT_258464 [Umbelopsis ramanniana AG]